MYNKVICETEVNKAKQAATAYQFIIDCKGNRSVKCAAHENKEVAILSQSEYESLVKSCFTDKKKQEILLSKEIPDQFTNSQLNNTRYISKIAMKLLSNIVREDGEDSFRSKHVLPITGIVTSSLKQDWQLNDAWNELIKPRFERLNKITNSNLFGEVRKINGHDVFINRVPEELSKNFEKKRIDHRHHAMDALVIALATENHVNYLNNISSRDSEDNKL
jgi:CRISPR-associated endonuclease Csn1